MSDSITPRNSTVPLPSSQVHSQGPEIKRDNLLDAIDDQLRSGHHALLVEGESGDGKTTLARAYAQRHQHRAILITISAASKWGYDPHYVLQNICAEASRLLDLPAARTAHLFQEADLQPLYSRLSRRGHLREPILFVIDGLHEIPDEDDHVRRRLLDLIPLGVTNICAVLTDSVPSKIKLSASTRAKSWRLSRFSLDETREFLRSVITDRKQINELHQLFKGRPASLAAIHRLITSGATPDELLSNADGQLTSLLSREWASLGPLSDDDLRIMGVLVFARMIVSIDDIARVLRRNKEEVRSLLGRSAFAQVSADTGAASITSDTMRQFVAHKTDRFKAEILAALIQDLQSHPATRTALVALPKYFQDAGRLEELLAYLTPQRLSETLGQCDTLLPLSDTLNAGLDAAALLKRDGDAYRLSLQRSAIFEMGKASSWDSYLNAVLALRDFDQAIGIAEAVPLSTERLLLLASIASSQRMDGLSPPTSLVDRINRLLDDVGDSLSSEEAISLAERLFAVLPDRATQLVQQAAASNRAGGSVDWALARLSISAAISRSAAEETGRDYADVGAAARSQIRDPEVRNFSTAAAVSLASVTAADALSQARTIENARDRLFFLRMWTDQNWRRDDAVQVTRDAIDLIVETTEYSPNARDVLRISRPLRYCNDQAEAMRCVARITALLGDLSERGPTAELSRLRILLASTTFRWHREEGRTRFQEEFFAISDVPDPAIKAECMARLISQLKTADRDQYLETVDQLHSLAKMDLHSCVDTLLESTADHYQMLAPVISALANTHPDLAELLLSRANTLNRRESLRLGAVRHMLRGPVGRDVLQVAIRLSRAAETPSIASDCVLAIWRECHRNPVELAPFGDLFDELGSTPFSCNIARDRAIAASLAYSTMRQAQCDGCEPLLARLRELIKSSLSKIDDAWDAVDACLEACTLVADGDAVLARECLDSAHTIQNQRLKGRYGPTWVVVAPIKLAMAALAGLMPKASDQAIDANRLLDLVSQLPAAALRAQLRSELAVWFYAARRLDDCRRVVQQHVLPEIRQFDGTHPELFNACVLAAADAIYLATPATAKEMFSRLDRELHDSCVLSAAAAKLQALPASEPCIYDAKHARKIAREDIDELMPLLPLAESDAASWSIVERVTSAIVEAGPTVFPAHQLGQIASGIEELATTLLPRKDWIRHDGYRVLWMAAARRIRGKKLELNESVISDARKLTNASDRCFVLAQVAVWATSDARSKLLEEAASIARSLPVEVEKIERLGAIAEVGMRHDKSIGKRLAREACQLSHGCDHGDMDGVRRRVMDAAYRTDRDLAGALAEVVDTDPARVSARANRATVKLQEQLKDLEASKQVIDHRGEESLPKADVDRLPKATWHALASLNGHRTQAKRLEDLRPFMRLASQLPLSRAYPIMAWILANGRIRFENTGSAAAILRPFFEASSLVGEFSMAAAFASKSMKFPAPTSGADPYLVRIGKQQEALETLDRWIAENVLERLLICDPYFGPDDLWVLRSILKHCPSAKVIVLTSKEKQRSVKADADDVFRSRWAELSDQDPPNTEVVVCGFVESGKLPVHDRWWIADSAGLRLGTSLSGLGSRESRITPVDPSELDSDRAMVEDYAVKRVRKSPDGKPIQYSTFLL